MESCFIERILNSELLQGWRHWQIVYQLEVFGQEGPQPWSIDFSQPEKLQIQKATSVRLTSTKAFPLQNSAH